MTLYSIRFTHVPDFNFRSRAIPCFDGLNESFDLRYRTTPETEIWYLDELIYVEYSYRSTCANITDDGPKTSRSSNVSYR